MTVEPVVEVEAVVDAAEASLRAAEKGAKHTSLLPRERNCTQQPPGAPENRTPRTEPAQALPDALTLSAPAWKSSRASPPNPTNKPPDAAEQRGVEHRRRPSGSRRSAEGSG